MCVLKIRPLQRSHLVLSVLRVLYVRVRSVFACSEYDFPSYIRVCVCVCVCVCVRV